MCVRAVRAAVIVLTGCVCVSVAGEKKPSVGSPNASGRAGCHRSLACRYASGVAPLLFVHALHSSFR